MSEQDTYQQQFFTTDLESCCYFEGRLERKLMTQLTGKNAITFHEFLSRRGFRRSHNMAYLPTCPQCQACIPVRVRVKEFSANRTMRRVIKRNQDLKYSIEPALASLEQYELFQLYQEVRHTDGDMSMMLPHDYKSMVEETPINTIMMLWRNSKDELISACLTDILSDGLSAVYSFYHPLLNSRSLGTYMILQLIQMADFINLPYVYLGFWIKNNPKMDYKGQFKPLDYFTLKNNWSPDINSIGNVS